MGILSVVGHIEVEVDAVDIEQYSIENPNFARNMPEATLAVMAALWLPDVVSFQAQLTKCFLRLNILDQGKPIVGEKTGDKYKVTLQILPMGAH